MGGLARRMPYTSALFFIGALSISALPPLNGFASELLIFTSFFSSVSAVDPLLKVLLFISLALFALTSALSAACFVKAFGSSILALPRSPESEGAGEVAPLMLIGPGYPCRNVYPSRPCLAPDICDCRLFRSPSRHAAGRCASSRYFGGCIRVPLDHCIPRSEDKRDMGMRHPFPAAGD